MPVNLCKPIKSDEIGLYQQAIAELNVREGRRKYDVAEVSEAIVPDTEKRYFYPVFPLRIHTTKMPEGADTVIRISFYGYPIQGKPPLKPLFNRVKELLAEQSASQES
jgi:hypothetical protein